MIPGGLLRAASSFLGALARLAERSGDEPGAIARHWFGVMRGWGDDVRELLHDGQPTACVADAALMRRLPLDFDIREP